MANRTTTFLAHATLHPAAWSMAALLAAAPLALGTALAAGAHADDATVAAAAATDARASTQSTHRSAQAALAQHALATLDGKAFTLASLRGQVVVVNFWASWCKPCRKELPRLDAFHRRIAGKGGAVAAVSIDLDARNAARFAERHHLSLPIYHDGPDGLASRLDLAGIPYSIVLDRDGTIAFTSTGADEAALEELEAVVLARIAGKPNAARNRIEAASASRKR